GSAHHGGSKRPPPPPGRPTQRPSPPPPPHFRQAPADLAYNSRDFMARGDGRLDISITLKKLVHKEHVAATHAAGLDVNQNFIRLNIGNRHVLKNEGFA